MKLLAPLLALVALLAVPSLAAAAPALSSASSADGKLHVLGADLLSAGSATPLTLRTTSSTVRIYRPDGSRAASNPSAVVWSAGEITVDVPAQIAGSRVIGFTLDTAQLSTPLQLAPLDVAAATGAPQQLTILASSGLASMAFVHVRDENGMWHRYANPRGVTGTDGSVLSWTGTQVTVKDPDLGGLEIQQVLVSMNASPLASALTDLQFNAGELLVAAVPTAEITNAFSPATCSVRIEGSGIAQLEYVNVDFDSLIQLPSGYISYLRVYPVGDSRNADAGTSVSVIDSELDIISITNSAICAKNVVTVSVLLEGGASGVAWYDPFTIL
jgi:hypothetical protein